MGGGARTEALWQGTGPAFESVRKPAVTPASTPHHPQDLPGCPQAWPPAFIFSFSHQNSTTVSFRRQAEGQDSGKSLSITGSKDTPAVFTVVQGQDGKQSHVFNTEAAMADSVTSQSPHADLPGSICRALGRLDLQHQSRESRGGGIKNNS